MFNINLFVHKLNCFRIDESLGKKLLWLSDSNKDIKYLLPNTHICFIQLSS